MSQYLFLIDARPFPAQQNVKWEGFQCAFQIFHKFSRSVSVKYTVLGAKMPLSLWLWYITWSLLQTKINLKTLISLHPLSYLCEIPTTKYAVLSWTALHKRHGPLQTNMQNLSWHFLAPVQHEPDCHFQNLSTKIQSHRYSRPSVQSNNNTFASYQPEHPFLEYIFFKFELDNPRSRAWMRTKVA